MAHLYVNVTPHPLSRGKLGKAQGWFSAHIFYETYLTELSCPSMHYQMTKGFIISIISIIISITFLTKCHKDSIIF